jgi:hypothetical protein
MFRTAHFVSLGLLLITSLVYVGYERRLAAVGFFTLGLLLALTFMIGNVIE